MIDKLPETGYLRLFQIVGNSTVEPPIPAIIPVGKSTWWAGVKSGRYPKPVKLGPRITAWRVEDIRSLIQQLSEQGEGFVFTAQLDGRNNPTQGNSQYRIVTKEGETSD